MQHFGKAALRVTKNYTKGYSDTQAKVRDATSNDPWGPSGTQMNEIAQMTYNQGDFVEIMEMLDKRLNDKGKNWRHVFKSLTVLDYCLHQGSENVVIYFRDNAYIVKTLKEFQYIDEDGKDQGANVRQKAKDITNLLTDESRLREERRARASMRDRMIRGAGGGEYDEDENESRRKHHNEIPPNGQLAGKRPNRDEDELRKAIEESKRSLAAEQISAEDRDLQKAIRLSEEEEARRKNLVEDSNASALFDDQNQLPSPSPQSNNPFPFSDPTPYSVGLQPQYTQIQPQFTQVQPQFTSFNPYQQQAEQEAAQAEYMRQQQMFLQQQQQAQQQQAQQEEWMRQQQLLQMQQQQQQQQQQNLFAPQHLVAQPTGFGSNNPFAPSPSTTPSFSSPVQTQPPAFNLSGTYEHNGRSSSNLSSLASSSPVPSSSSPYQNQQQGQKPFQVKTKKELGENEQHLASLFANRDDGTDTFGNYGPLRYGPTEAGRIIAQKTGTATHNPFAQQQQNNERPFFEI
ncbi:Epsin-1 [Hypsizygus marmoreus]|uniref:Epsin-1 n=1 Tax=Hypsizygus marmoreus TaxID=39966 RepID=A0A369JN00_HYPMA|nr:Epsin-1 [Hypsizygus marmoreus]